MTNESLLTAITELITEDYRLKKTFERLVCMADFSGRSRYMSQIAWHDKRLSEIAGSVGLNIISFEEQQYDEGMAVAPLNAEEFDKNETLFIEQMIEPTIMHEGRVIKTGTAVLAPVEK